MTTPDLPDWATCQECGDRYARAYLARCYRCHRRVCPSCRRLREDGTRMCLSLACAMGGGKGGRDADH